MAKIKSPVGGGKKAVNDPKDVKTVQHLLNNHMETLALKPLRVSGSIDQPTITAIGKFQKVVVGTAVTSLVEPGSKTMKALMAKPAPVQPSGKPLKGKVYQVKWRGKVHLFTEDNMEDAKAAISLRLDAEVLRFLNTYKNYRDQYREMRKGFLTFFVELVTPNAELERPEASLKKAQAELDKLVNLAFAKNNRDLLAAFKQMRQTKIAFDAVAADINMLAKELGESAKICADISLDLRDGAFDICQLILVANGVNPTAAGAGVAAAKNTVQEVANAIVNTGTWVKEGGVMGSQIRITFGAVAGGFSGWVGGKVGKVFMAKFGGALAGRMASGRFANNFFKLSQRWGTRPLRLFTERELSMASKEGAEIAIQTVIRISHKLFTGRMIVKFLTEHAKELEAIVTRAANKAKSEGDFVGSVVDAIEKSGLAVKIADQILEENRGMIERAIVDDLKKAGLTPA